MVARLHKNKYQPLPFVMELLKNEVIYAECPKVLNKTLSSIGEPGTLYVTNFRVTFVSAIRPLQYRESWEDFLFNYFKNLRKCDLVPPLQLQSDDSEISGGHGWFPPFISVPLGTISHILKSGGRTRAKFSRKGAGYPYYVSIISKDFSKLKFSFDPNIRKNGRSHFVKTILAVAHPKFIAGFEIPTNPSDNTDSDILPEGQQEIPIPVEETENDDDADAENGSNSSSKIPYPDKLFAFISGKNFSTPLTDGWEIFQFKKYFTLQNISFLDYSAGKKFATNNHGFPPLRVSAINDNFGSIPTYPEKIIVPASISDDTLKKVIKFRSKGRIPSFSYQHYNGATMFRCSQPLTGVQNSRCREDEKLLKSILDGNPNQKKNEYSKCLWIMDARPKKNAVGNSIKGAGYEHSNHYSFAKILFLGIENIHVMRNSLAKVRTLTHDYCGGYGDAGNLDLQNEKKDFLKNIHASEWLHHVGLVIDSASLIVKLMDAKGASVLVHCSDGWDRTSQLCCLAMILMNPHFRTIHGFQALIEREWLAHGHKFAQRYGQASEKHTDTQRSPIFIQFIDCVYQLLHNFPRSFEFNQHFLMDILDHVYSCRFGTFLFNQPAQRHRAKLSLRTDSLWTFLNHPNYRQYYTNPSYPYNAPGRVKAIPLPFDASHRGISLLFWNPKWDIFSSGTHALAHGALETDSSATIGDNDSNTLTLSPLVSGSSDSTTRSTKITAPRPSGPSKRSLWPPVPNPGPQNVMYPAFHSSDIVLWKEYHLRHHPKFRFNQILRGLRLYEVEGKAISDHFHSIPKPKTQTKSDNSGNRTNTGSKSKSLRSKGKKSKTPKSFK